MKNIATVQRTEPWFLNPTCPPLNLRGGTLRCDCVLNRHRSCVRVPPLKLREGRGSYDCSLLLNLEHLDAAVVAVRNNQGAILRYAKLGRGVELAVLPPEGKIPALE